MTDRSAIFSADFVDLAFKPGLKCARLTFDIPIEHAAAFIQAFGAPDRVSPVKCAIARLEIGPDSPIGRGAGSPSDAAQGHGKSHQPVPIHKGKPFRELKRSQQAALKLKDDDFCRWMYGKYRNDVVRLEKKGAIEEGGLYADYADTVLKAALNILSKTDLDKWLEAGEKWDKMLVSFETETRYGVS